MNGRRHLSPQAPEQPRRAWHAVLGAALLVVLGIAAAARHSAILLPAALGFAAGAAAVMLYLRRELDAAARRIAGDEASTPRLAATQRIIAAHERVMDYHQETIEKLSDETDMLVERYEVLTENLAAAIVIRDSQGRIACCSPYTEVLTGGSIDDIYACHDRDFFANIVHSDDRELYAKALRVNSCGEAFQFRYRFLHKTGIEMWAETRSVPIMDEQGEVTSSLAINFDVTGLIRRQQLIQEKNRDLEDFSYMISHDLKAPIFTIKGMLQILKEDFGDALKDGLQEAMQHIDSAVGRLEQLVQAVVDYSRIGSRESVEEPVELDALLADIRSELQPLLTSCGGELLAAELPTVRGDRLKLYQIFSNLLGNAVKYRSPHRPLRIEVVHVPGEGNLARLVVRDNGLGIPAARLGDIFRPFQRAHGREIEGSGIGLACVKKLVTMLGGEVAVASTEGTGSEFSVTLPKADAKGLEMIESWTIDSDA